MIYREAGQFKTSYAADHAIFPILQDRMFIIAVLLVAYLVVPFVASPYFLVTIMIPSLIFCIAALGLNVLTGYAGQLSLGTGGFMAVGAYATFKMTTAFPDLNIIIVFLLSGLFAAAVGVLFGIPSLRIKGFYLAVATLAAQFFLSTASPGSPTTTRRVPSRSPRAISSASTSPAAAPRRRRATSWCCRSSCCSRCWSRT